jgi:hypothetical protein
MLKIINYFRTRVIATAVILICVGSLGLMLLASTGESAIMDELAHLPAGFGYVRYLDYRLNPEHPPLLKALAGLPLLFLNPNFPTQSSAWTTDINGQWQAGTQFLYEAGNDANTILRLARIAPIIISLLLIILVYFWAKELMGNRWALLPTFLTAFSPHFLAHGHYVTTDVIAALGIGLATFAFLKFLFNPTKKYLLYSGIAFGIAQITKFSAALLVPYFFLLIVVFYIAEVIRARQQPAAEPRRKHFCFWGRRYLGNLALIFVIGYLLIVYPFYFIFTINYPQEKQTTDTEFILGSFAKGPPPPGEKCNPLRCLAEVDIWMTKNPVTRPLAHYLLGVLMVMQRAAGGNTAYFLGEVSASGWHYYFPVVYLLKEPLPVLIMVFLALFLSIGWVLKKVPRFRFFGRGMLREQIPEEQRVASGRQVLKCFLDYLGVNFAEFSMLVFIILYWGWSITSPLNIGFRHLLPALPFIYILTAGVMKRWITKLKLPATDSFLKLLWNGFKAFFAASLKYIFLFALLLWFLAETLAASPYFLSYFNEIGGGIKNGYRYVADSNYDWGQDLLRLKEFVKKHPEIDKIAVDYFGGGNPRYYLGNQAENWWAGRGNPAKENIHWFAVSVNTLQGAIQRLHPGQQRNPTEEYSWLVQLRPPKPGWGNVPAPDYRAGTSIFIYKL